MWQNLTEFEKRLLETLQLTEPEVPVWVEDGGCGIELQRTESGWMIRLENPAMLGRATVLLEQYIDRPVGWCYREQPAYARLGVMVDCSRNAVPTIHSLQKLLRMLCRMGYNTVQLYMESCK